ncbi:MAG: SAM hydrolase/SAM-dependent halogenase family protein [Gemmatimonadaceae bacterium]
MRRLITLITDFGTADGYVGEMKGVLLSLAPDADVVDITHDIAPQDVDHARFTLARVWRRFPRGTVHLVIVDPEVGSSRAALAVSSGDKVLVGPDNGVLSPALLFTGVRAVSLQLPPNSSATFHGRDVFAPAAAALARGEPIDALGVDAPRPLIRRTPEPSRRPDGTLDGEVIMIDRFGNAITNLVALHGGIIEVADHRIAVRRTYAEVAPHQPVAVVGSSGFVEVAVRDGDASRTLGLTRGSRVVLRTSG